MTPMQLYETVIAQCLSEGPPRRRTTVRFEMDEPGEAPLIQWSGFYPNRWVGYCDDYLGGGPVMDEWLRDPGQPLLFENGAHHTKGACIRSLTHSRGVLTLESRACNWVPVGILDLKLLWMVWRRLGARRALWVVDDLATDPATVISYHRWRSLLTANQSEFATRSIRILEETPPEALDKHRPGMLGRHKKAVRRGREAVVADESRIADAFTFAVPRDFVWESEGALRESWVTRAVGKRGYGEYQWDRLDYQELEPVLRRLGRIPRIEDLARRRAARG